MTVKTIFDGAHFSDEAGSSRVDVHPVLMLLIFAAVFILTGIAQGIFSVPLLIPAMMMAGDDAELANLYSLPASLFSTLMPALLVMAYVKYIEKRPLSTMGLSKKKFASDYFKGFLLGFGVFSAVVVLCLATGQIRFNGTAFSGGVPFIVIMCLGWVIQGAEEEILCRGWLMTSLSRRMPLWAAAVINSVFFALLHFSNPGFSVMAFINLVLAGLLLSVIAIRFDSLIPACAFHTAWNLVQGNFYGLAVSGLSCGYSVFSFSPTAKCGLMGGGEFGPESSLADTIISVIVIAAIIFLPKKEKMVESE